jgi:hypothetical protein
MNTTINKVINLYTDDKITLIICLAVLISSEKFITIAVYINLAKATKLNKVSNLKYSNSKIINFFIYN